MEHIRALSGEDIRINQDYQPPVSPILLFLVNLAPFFIIILVMSLVMNWMAKKGMGGIGGGIPAGELAGIRLVYMAAGPAA